jgi:hypothetical protein
LVVTGLDFAAIDMDVCSCCAPCAVNQPYEIRGLNERARAPEARLITETGAFLQCGGPLPVAGVRQLRRTGAGRPAGYPCRRAGLRAGLPCASNTPKDQSWARRPERLFAAIRRVDQAQSHDNRDRVHLVSGSEFPCRDAEIIHCRAFAHTEFSRQFFGRPSLRKQCKRSKLVSTQRSHYLLFACVALSCLPMIQAESRGTVSDEAIEN